MKSLVIMGIIIFMGISSSPLTNTKSTEDINSTAIKESVCIEDTESEDTDIEDINDADSGNVIADPETSEEQTEQQETTINDEDVLECRELIQEEFFEGVVSVKSHDRWKPITEKKDIDKLKEILWRFKLKETKTPTFDLDFVLGGKSFSFIYEDGTEVCVSVSGVMFVYDGVWYDIVNWDEMGMQFYEDIAILYPEGMDYYGEDVFNCWELLPEEYFDDVEEVSYSYGDNTLKKEKEIEKFKKKMWLFRVRKSEKTDSKKPDSLVFGIKSKDGSEKNVIINEESMIIDGECYDIVNYWEVLIMFLEGMDELFPSAE